MTKGTCKDCLYWGDAIPDDTARSCAILDNDFCCEGQSDGMLAGVIGGGSFRTMPDFSCVYWKSWSRLVDAAYKLCRPEDQADGN